MMTKDVTKAILDFLNLLKVDYFSILDSFKLPRQLMLSPALIIQKGLFAFILSTFMVTSASNAWAVIQNTTVKRDVYTFADKYGIQQNTGKSASQAAKDFEDKLDSIKMDYFKKSMNIMQQCSEIWLKNLAKTLGDRGKSTINHGTEAVKAFFNGDLETWKAEGKASFDNAKSGVKTYLTDGVLSALETHLRSVALFASKLAVPKCMYSYESELNNVESMCQALGNANEDPKIRALIEELRPIAKETQNNADSFCLLKGNNGEIFEHCVEDSKGKPVCTKFVIDFGEGTITSLDGNTIGCQPLPFKVYEARSCLFCPMFTVIFNAIQASASKAYSTLAKPLSTILLIGLAIWIALMVLSNVSALTKQDATKFLTDLFKNSFKVVIAFILLRYSSIVYDVIIGPLLKAGFEFGGSFLDHSSDLMKNCEIKSSALGGGGVLPNYIYTHLLCFIEAVQNELGVTQAIGSSLMCIARHKGAGDITVLALKQMLPDFSMLFQGFLIWGISFIISVAFGFYLIDATIQLGIFGILLPFLLMCYPFKITSGYFNTGVGVFMNSWFIFVFMGLVTNITLALIGQGATGGKGDMYSIETAINGNDIQTLTNLLEIGFAGFVVLLACCVFAIKLMQKVQELAGKFSGGGLNLGIGAKVGGLAASGVTNSAKWAKDKTVGMAKGAANARIFGKDGEEKSMADYGRAARSKVGRGVGKAIQWAPKKIGKFFGVLGRGRGRRDPSE